jgi:SAM-dependent methyltransferase
MSQDGKRYDRAYFDRWYRARGAVVSAESVQRKARLAIAAAEHLLGREVRNVLDVGCGEGQWRALLRRVRPKLHYTGIDPSEYAVRRFGRRRNLRLGRFGELGSLRIAKGFDLIICSDVLQYVSRSEMRSGLRAIAQRLRGVAYIEAFATEDDMVGDRDGWHYRSAATYRAELRAAGLTACGLYCYVSRELKPAVNALELGR